MNSSSSATAKSVAGESVFGRVIVEVGELLLEPPDALVLLLVATQVRQERGVVIGGERARLSATVTAFLAHKEPQQRAHDRKHHDEHAPHEFRQGPNPPGIGEHEVDYRKHVQRHNDEGHDHEQAGHVAILGTHSARSLRAYTGRVKPWVAYSLVRVGIFAVAFAVAMLAGAQPWLAAIIAAVIGLCVSYIFFRRLRDAVAVDLAERRARPPGDIDSAVEDR